MAQLAALEKKRAQLITTKQVLVQEAPELGGAICTSRGMPQDVRISPDGKTFFVADMLADGVHVVDGDSFKQIGFIPTGVGAHGLYPSRDGKIALRRQPRHQQDDRRARRGEGQRVGDRLRHPQGRADLADPGRRQPRHGQCQRRRQISLADAAASTTWSIASTPRSGAVDKVKVGREPHGLTVWPQPGRYSLGHTGNLR